MVGFMMAAAIPAATPVAAPVSPAEPAMFVVRDADTTIYIFGTFHALDGQAHWFSTPVRTALEQSQELVLETLVPEQPALPAQPNQFNAPSVTPSASFLATTRMAINAGRAQGMQVN